MIKQIDGQEVEVKRLFVRNAHLAWGYLEKFSVTDNAMAAWSDATSVAVAFCTDRQGDSVIASLGPFSMTAVDATNHPGYYYYIVPTSVTALLDTDEYRGRTIYQRITAGASSEVKVVTPWIVTEPRFADLA